MYKYYIKSTVDVFSDSFRDLPFIEVTHNDFISFVMDITSYYCFDFVIRSKTYEFSQDLVFCAPHNDDFILFAYITEVF